MKVLYTNARSIVNKVDELRIFANISEPDVIALTNSGSKMLPFLPIKVVISLTWSFLILGLLETLITMDNLGAVTTALSLLIPIASAILLSTDK